MAKYNHLPIYKKAMEVSVYLQNIVRNLQFVEKMVFWWKDVSIVSERMEAACQKSVCEKNLPDNSLDLKGNKDAKNIVIFNGFNGFVFWPRLWGLCGQR